MKVKKLEIQNFRNISDIRLEFDDEINVICGENAQGKTNIIEALWLFSGAKSFRNTKDSEFIKFGEKKSKIFTEYEMLGVENTAQIVFDDILIDIFGYCVLRVIALRHNVGDCCNKGRQTLHALSVGTHRQILSFL